MGVREKETGMVKSGVGTIIEHEDTKKRKRVVNTECL